MSLQPSKIVPIIHFLFELQANIKFYHWNTSVYARHKAADDLVDKVNDLGDRFIEAYIGKYGRPLATKQPKNLQLQHLDDDSVVQYLQKCITYLLTDVPKILNKDDVDLFNIRDEIVAVLNSTKYLFSFK